MIQAVIFDIDGVLLDSFEANLKFFQNLMTRFGYPSPTREEYRPLFHLPLRDVIARLTQSSSEEELRKIWKSGQARETPYPSELLTMPEDAEEIIKALYEQYCLGIATSRVRNGVYESLHLSRLRKYFRAVRAYEDTEQHKPHPDPLLFTAEKLGVAPEVAVYVGDVENDIIAARAAGMKIILYAKEPLPTADACTSDFRALTKIIAGL